MLMSHMFRLQLATASGFHPTCQLFLLKLREKSRRITMQVVLIYWLAFQTFSDGCPTTFAVSLERTHLTDTRLSLTIGSYTLQSGLVHGYPYWKMDHPTRNFHVFRGPGGKNWFFSDEEFDKVKRLQNLSKPKLTCLGASLASSSSGRSKLSKRWTVSRV